MKIVKKMFTSQKEAKRFWDFAAYDVLDIIIALNDMGLQKEALTFSIHFGEPDLMKIYTNFMIDFKGIKNQLGIPEVYTDLDTEIVENIEEMQEPKRDVSKITVSKEFMKENFDAFLQDFSKEQKYMVEELKKVQNELIEKGILKKEEVKPFEVKSQFEEYFKSKISPEDKK